MLAACASVSLEPPPLFPLVEIVEGPTVKVDLRYKTSDNLTGKPLYPKNFKPFVRPELLEDLRRAANYLKARGYGLVVLDAWRPPVASALLWNEAVAQDLRHIYAPPDISGHTKGASVDVTLFPLASSSAVPVMPSDFDCHVSGKNETPHSRLLAEAMRWAGFSGHPLEWWHFDHPIGKSVQRVDNPWEMSGYHYRGGKLYKGDPVKLPD
jgi:D-alanyl-D-alanine dipeptidase